MQSSSLEKTCSLVPEGSKLLEIFYPLSPIHHFYICDCLTDGATRIVIALIYLSRYKSPVSKVSPSHWERVQAALVPERIGALIIFSVLKKSLVVSGFKRGECFIHCAMPIRQLKEITTKFI